MQTTSPVEENARRASVDAGSQEARARGTPSVWAERTAAAVGPPEFGRSRDTGREIRTHTLARLGSSLGHGAETVERGDTVPRCGTADDDGATLSETRREAGARTVTEGTAMIGEETGINGHPERHGIAPVETDPGEHIIHLRRAHPGHMPRAERRDGVTGGVVLVTGPSRSAGIEQPLEPGARSPRRPYVVLVEDDPAALIPEGHA